MPEQRFFFLGGQRTPLPVEIVNRDIIELLPIAEALHDFERARGAAFSWFKFAATNQAFLAL